VLYWFTTCIPIFFSTTTRCLYWFPCRIQESRGALNFPAQGKSKAQEDPTSCDKREISIDLAPQYSRYIVLHAKPSGKEHDSRAEQDTSRSTFRLSIDCLKRIIASASRRCVNDFATRTRQVRLHFSLWPRPRFWRSAKFGQEAHMGRKRSSLRRRRLHGMSSILGVS
jgi:hypothetical protein